MDQNKKSLETIKAFVIAPVCPTQSWFNRLLELEIEQPMIIESKYLRLPCKTKNILFIPN